MPQDQHTPLSLSLSLSISFWAFLGNFSGSHTAEHLSWGN